MARLSFFISLGLVFSSLPSGLAGPACARRHYQAADCVQRCKSKWGWTGALMNTDPWGSVITKVDLNKDINAVIAAACGTTQVVSTTAVPVSTSAEFTRSISTALPTESVISSASSVVSSQTTFIRSTTSAVSSNSRASPSSSIPVAQGFVASKGKQSSSTFSTAPPPITTNIPVRPASTIPLPPRSSVTSAKPVVTSAAPAVANTDSGSSSTSSADIQAYLAGHNTIRAQHGASPLTWSNSLAAKAQQWANGCVFQHSGGSLGPFGENLAAGTGSDYGIATAIKSWTDEVSQYDASNPVPSHFTQVVWKGTTQVGCAVQSCNGIFAASFGAAKYFVCEYSAQGNIIGRFAQNVQV